MDSHETDEDSNHNQTVISSIVSKLIDDVVEENTTQHYLDCYPLIRETTLETDETDLSSNSGSITINQSQNIDETNHDSCNSSNSNCTINSGDKQNATQAVLTLM